MGGAALEGLVDDPEDAVALFESGSSVSLEPCHHRSAVGPMAGVVTPSMWMWVLEDRATGRRTYCSLNEGLGKVLRYGAYGPEVLTRLRWMGDVLGPLLQAAVRGTEEATDVTGILTQMLQMGDEAHNRNRAGTLMLLRDLSPAMVSSGSDAGSTARTSPTCCASSAATTTSSSTSRCPRASSRSTPAATSPGSTMVVAMARNGTDFGIQVSGTGDEWFTGPAQVAEGLFLGDYGPDDANADIGDSAITETAGIGGFAMATAPAIVRLVGGTGARRARHHPADARDHARGEPALVGARPGVPGHAHRHRRDQGVPHRRSCRRSTPAWPARSPASARSAPGSSPRPRRSSRRRSPRSPRLPLARPGRSGVGRPLVVDAGRLLAGEAARWRP